MVRVAAVLVFVLGVVGCTDYYAHVANFAPASVLNVTATVAIAVDCAIVGETTGKGCASCEHGVLKDDYGSFIPGAKCGPDLFLVRVWCALSRLFCQLLATPAGFPRDSVGRCPTPTLALFLCSVEDLKAA